MHSSERDTVPENVKAATAWLAARRVGASLVEFLQKLPTEEAEKVYLAVAELKRLKAENKRHGEVAQDLVTWSWIGGGIGVATLHSILSSTIATGPLFVIDGLVVAMIYALVSRRARREYSQAGNAFAEQLDLEESAFKRIGIIFRESDGTVHSRARLAEAQKQIEKELQDNQSVLNEIQRGAALARNAGLGTSLLQNRLGTVLGGLPTEELLEHPDCERLFHEMSELGLRVHTIEAILMRHGNASLPISTRTLEIANARMQAVR